MDSAYDSPLIKQRNHSLGHVPIIGKNPRNKEVKKTIESKQSTQRKAGYNHPESKCYPKWSTVDRKASSAIREYDCQYN